MTTNAEQRASASARESLHVKMEGLFHTDRIFERVHKASLYYFQSRHGYRKVVMKLRRKPRRTVARVAQTVPLDQMVMQELAMECLKRGHVLTVEESGAHLLACRLAGHPVGLPKVLCGTDLTKAAKDLEAANLARQFRDDFLSHL